MSTDSEKPHGSSQRNLQPETMEASRHHDVFIQYYSKLTSILKIRSLVDHFISERIIGVEEKQSISVDSLLSTIESHLKSDINATFFRLLDVMATFGDLATQDLAKSIKKKLSTVVPSMQEDAIVTVDFSTFEEVEVMFPAFVSALRNMLNEDKFNMIRIGCITNNQSLSTKLPIDFVDKVHATETLDDLFDVVISSPYCNWMNIRLLEKIAAASLQSNAHQLIDQYKNAVFSKKLKDVFKHIPSQVKDEYYYSKVKQRWKKEFDNVTVKDVIEEWNKLENLLDVEKLMLLLLDFEGSQQPLSTSDGLSLRTDNNSNRNEECERPLKLDDLCCEICHELACDLFITNKCRNHIFCSKCLIKEHLKDDTEDDDKIACPLCKTNIKKEKCSDDFDDHSATHCSSFQCNHHLQADQTSVIIRVEDDVGGIDCDFVKEPPDDLLCKICHFPARDPQQTNLCCGQTFCAICLHKYVNSKILGNKQCPFCKTVPFTFLPDAKTKHHVENLEVYCPYKSLGCTWTGELRSLEEHLVKDIDNKRGCPFTELQCSNGCGVVMQRRLVEGHLKSECELREVKCEYCNTTGSYQWINSSHHEECPKYPVECPNHCEVGHARRGESPLAITKCLFTAAGCKSVLNSKTANTMEHVYMKAVVTPPHTICVLQSTTELLQKTKEVLETEILTHKEDKFKKKSPKRREELELMERFASKLTDNFGGCQDCRWSLQLSYLHNTCNNILPNVYVKITEFVLHPKGIFNSWSSQPFYTCGKGYKMCISVSSNNNYVSVWALLMSGEYDNHLRWPVKGTLKIQLLNQFYDGNHTEPVDIVFDGAEDNPCCKRVLVGDRSHFGNCFETFISHKSLAENVKNKQNYYKNITLYFKILEFVTT